MFLYEYGIKRENNASYIKGPGSHLGALGLSSFSNMMLSIWLHLDDKYDENMIRPETLGEWVQCLDVADERRHVLPPVRALRTLSICEGFYLYIYISQHFHAPCLTRVHFDGVYFSNRSSVRSCDFSYDKWINVKIKRWCCALPNVSGDLLYTNALISLSEFLLDFVKLS